MKLDTKTGPSTPKDKENPYKEPSFTGFFPDLVTELFTDTSIKGLGFYGNHPLN